MKSLGKAINPSRNPNPFNHDTNYIKLYTSLKDGTNNNDDYGQLIKTQYLDDVFNFVNTLPQVTRKVRVQLDRLEFLHMLEVQVFNYAGENVALGKTATQSSTFSPFPASYAVDGNLGTYSHTNNNLSEYHIQPAIFPSIMYYFNPIITSLLRFYKLLGGR